MRATESECGIDRRVMLATTCVGAISCVAPTHAHAQPDRKLEIRKAVKFQMVAETISVADKFRLLKDIGFDGTEIPNNGNYDRREIHAAIEESDLPVHGVINAADPNLKSAIDLAKFYGGDSVLVVADENDAKTYQDNFAHWQRLIGKAIEHAEKNDVRLLIENVRATFLKTAGEMSRFIDSFESPMVAAYFDTGNTITWTDQSAEHWAKTLGSRIAKLDIKDRGHAEFGDARLRSKKARGTDGGEVHWQRVRQELAKVKFTGWATAEVKGGNRKRLQGIASWMDQVLGL